MKIPWTKVSKIAAWVFLAPWIVACFFGGLIVLWAIGLALLHLVFLGIK